MTACQALKGELNRRNSLRPQRAPHSAPTTCICYTLTLTVTCSPSAVHRNAGDFARLHKKNEAQCPFDHCTVAASIFVCWYCGMTNL